MFMEKYKQIKNEILAGGLIIAGRNSGKTMAMVEVLIDNPKAILLVHNYNALNRVKQLLAECGGKGFMAIDRVMLGGTKDLTGIVEPDGSNVYVDEWHLNAYRGPFKAAVTSVPYVVKVVS